MWDAERHIKRNLLAFPATYDEHQLDTTSLGLEMGEVTKLGDGTWMMESVILFGTKNAFGVQQDFMFHYLGHVDKDENCLTIDMLSFEPYDR